jgi:hypothetical protein
MYAQASVHCLCAQALDPTASVQCQQCTDDLYTLLAPQLTTHACK